jgi:hypothetical protein
MINNHVLKHFYDSFLMFILQCDTYIKYGESETISDTFVLNYTFLSELFNCLDPIMLVILLFPSFHC